MKKENNTYNGWLISNSFVKRTLAIVTYYTIGQISLILIAIVLLLLFNIVFQ